MTPVERAAFVYESEPCARTFREDLEAHLINGYVYSSPSFFVMARPVDSSAGYDLVTDPWHTFAPESCDAWLIYLFAGEMAAAVKLFPYALPKIGFERKNNLRFYRFEGVINRLVRL